MAWQTRPMVCRSPTDRKNVSVGLKREWSWNRKNLRLTFHSSRELFLFLDLRSDLPNLATLGLTTGLHYDLGKGKVLSRNEKFAFDFSYSWTLSFQPYRRYIPTTLKCCIVSKTIQILLSTNTQSLICSCT